MICSLCGDWKIKVPEVAKESSPTSFYALDASKSQQEQLFPEWYYF
jgi:hypothetical protein